MTKTKIKVTAIVPATFFIFVLLISCSDNSGTNNTSRSGSRSIESDPYEIMHVAFEGSPEIDKIKPMLESVMDNFGFPKTNDNRLKIANMLVSLRKASAVGVTEMDILKHIYQNGSNKISLAEQAGLSATILEKSK